MGVIFVVSPDYLDSIFDEARKYSFKLQGYGDFKKAKAGLLHTNAKDILGFAYVSDQYPSNLTDMFSFLNACELLSSNKKFLFISKSKFDARIAKYVRDNCKNIRSYVQTVEYVSDITVNRDVFGNLLFDNYAAYDLKPEQKPILSDYTATVLKFKPVINQQVLSVLGPFDRLDTVEHTLELDIPFNNFGKRFSILGRLREMYIRRSFGQDVSKQLTNLMGEINAESAELYCIYQALASSI